MYMQLYRHPRRKKKIEDINMRLPTSHKLAVALAIASVGAAVSFTRVMAQTPSQPQKLTGSAAAYA